jgi:hypothetical protein
MDEFSNATVTNIENISFGEMINERPIANDLMVRYFRLNPNNITQSNLEKINEIGEWVKSKTDSEMEMVKMLKDIKYRLGSPKLGMSDIDHIYTYIALRRQSESLESQAKSMEV